MLISILAGLTTGLIGVACWSIIQLFSNLPALSAWKSGYQHLAPISIAVISAILYASIKAPFLRTEPLPDILENYFYGFFRQKPVLWLQRGITTFLCVLMSGTFGIEGAIIELSAATHPLIAKVQRLFIEEKQTFILSTISGALCFAFNAPFSGCLIALELTQAQESRIRIGAIVASLISFATASLIERTLFPHYIIDGGSHGNMILSQLFLTSHSLKLESIQWLWLSVAAIGVAVAISGIAKLNEKVMFSGLRFFNSLLEHKKPMLFILGGLLMSLALSLNSEYSINPPKLIEDLAWLRISGPSALVYFVLTWSVFIIALISLGSTGLFTPFLLLGALFGYFAGNLFTSEWCVPLALVGAFSFFSATYGLSLSLIALVLELDGIGPNCWLATAAIITVQLASRYLKVKPLHKSMFEISNVRISSGRVTSVLSKIKAEDAMYRDFQTLSINAGVQELRQAALHTSHNFLGIVSNDGKYIGLLAIEQLPLTVRRILKTDAIATDVLAVERVLELRYLIDTNIPVLSPDDTAEKALMILQKTPCVAVVDGEKQIRGLLFESSIAGRYKREIANISIREG